jgi:hypothetical protein
VRGSGQEINHESADSEEEKGMESTKSTEDKQHSGKQKGKQANKQGEPKLREVRREAVAVMSPEVKEIAKALAGLAKEGNCPAAKLVFEFLGIFPPPAAEEEEDDTLARYLLRQLGIPDHPTEEEITKVLNAGSEANADNVESS